jgi:hypothetical protein
LERYSKALFERREPELDAVAKNLVDKALELLRDPANASSTTRRGAGIPLLIRSIALTETHHHSVCFATIRFPSSVDGMMSSLF